MVREGNALLLYPLLEILRASKQALRRYIKCLHVCSWMYVKMYVFWGVAL